MKTKKFTIPTTIYYSANEAQVCGLGYFPTRKDAAVEITVSECPKNETPTVTVAGVPESEHFDVRCVVNGKLGEYRMNVKVEFTPIDLPKRLSQMYFDLVEAVQECVPHK